MISMWALLASARRLASAIFLDRSGSIPAGRGGLGGSRLEVGSVDDDDDDDGAGREGGGGRWLRAEKLASLAATSARLRAMSSCVHTHTKRLSVWRNGRRGGGELTAALIEASALGPGLG